MTGSLAQGEALPSMRFLAKELRISVITTKRAYEELERDPVACLGGIYEALGLDGFEAARPRFEAYVAGQKDYVKNHFTLTPRLRGKINGELGFYFEHYGYEMRTED